MRSRRWNLEGVKGQFLLGSTLCPYQPCHLILLLPDDGQLLFPIPLLPSLFLPGGPRAAKQGEVQVWASSDDPIAALFHKRLAQPVYRGG